MEYLYSVELKSVCKENLMILSEDMVTRAFHVDMEPVHVLAEKIRTEPELSFQEFKACEWQVGFLQKQGFTTVAPYCGIETAYRAEFVSGKGAPVFAFCAEYDALPEIGHGCGHHLICGSAIAAALFVKNFLEENKIGGRVVVLGCPGEEGGGGKVDLAERGALNDIDALMMVHPTGENIVVHGEYAGVCSAQVTYKAGKAGSPVARFANPEFTNPLDAQVLLYQAVALKRHYMPLDSAIAGCIPEGGVKANMIPARTKSLYTLRSSNMTLLEELSKMFSDMAKGAALLTGTEVEVTLSMRYKPTIPSLPLRDSYLENMEKLGMEVTKDRQVRYGMAGTDFGNFSQIRPGIHAHFPLGQKVAAHTAAFVGASATREAYENMFTAAKAMAMTAFQYFTDPGFRQKVKEDFAGR